MRASAAVRPLRSVRAPPTSDQPPPRPGLRVHGDAGHRERLEVAPCGALGDLELVGELGRRHPTSRLEDQQGRDESVGAHGSDLLTETGQEVASSPAA